MFEHKSLPSRVFAYKADAPIAGLSAIESQLRWAHRYYNTLVHLERKRRRLTDEALAALRPELPGLKAAWEAADAEVKALVAVVKARNQAERKRRATPEERQRLQAARAAKRDAYAPYKAARAEAFADPEVRSALEAVEADHDVALKAARKRCGLYWGTYLLVEDALKAIRKGAPPEFVRWTAERLFAAEGDAALPVLGEGAVGVQIQKGMAWEDALAGQDQRLRVQYLPLPDAADPESGRSRRERRAVAWIRVGSEGRAPVWAQVPFRMHRMPPPGCQIKWVRLHRRLIGGRVEWSLQFVLSAAAWDRGDAAAGGECGIDLGWRKRPDGLRVAYLVGTDGHAETLVLPQAFVAKLDHAESLGSIADRAFDAARARFAAWLGTHPELVPEWLAAITTHLRLWKSAGKLAAVVVRWRDNRFAGDAEVFADMEAWRRQDKHLRDWKEAETTKVKRRRNDLYRKFARSVARRYATVCLEDMDIAELKAVPDPLEPGNGPARLYGHEAAPGLLRTLIVEAAQSVAWVDPANTTRRCHCCGALNEFDAAASLVWTCTACGAAWDQDHNAAVWLLRRGAGPA